jgi:hypothetical protein
VSVLRLGVAVEIPVGLQNALLQLDVLLAL